MSDPKGSSKYTQTINLIREIATYFMDFLETDFHKRRSPKRKIIFKNNENLLCGIKLNKYPNFYSKILTAISHHSLDGEKISTVSKGVYKYNIPKNLVAVIHLQLSRYNKKHFNDFNEFCKLNAEEMSTLYKDNINNTITHHLDTCVMKIKEEFVSLFIETIKNPLLETGTIDENDIFSIEEDLLNVIKNSIDEKVARNMQILISNNKNDESRNSLDFNYLTNDSFNNLITTFFNEYKLGDLYLELDEIERNKKILDKQELYLNIGDIYYEKNKYPIFYIPIQCNKDDEKYRITYESQLYINKKALEYIEQQFNINNNSHGHLDGFRERIIYLTQLSNLGEFISSRFKELEDFFQLKDSINLETKNYQVTRNNQVSISNDIYITLFDKADESLINDYESILELINQGGEGVAGLFRNLIDGFFFDEAISINPRIEDEWEKTSVTKKLVIPSPIPLNSEQRKILNALNSSQGKFYVVQGPPGTGKSHTITAIVFDSLLKGNSILVLSDKNEALDVVEDKITETLNKIRREKNFQNPILRLGRSSKTYTQILATQNIEKIKQHYKVVKNKLKDLDHDIEHTSKVIESRIRDEIIGYSEVNINNIRELQLIEKYLDKKGWIIEKGLVNQVENLGIYLNDLSLAILSVSEIASLDSDFTNLINRLFKSSNLITLLDLKSTLFKVDSIIKIYKEVSKSTNYLDEILLFGYNDYKKPHELTKILEELIELRNPIWGYLFKKKNLDKLNFKFREAFPNSKIKRIEDDPQLISNAVIASNNILDKEESYFPEDDVNLLNTLNIIKSDETLLKILEHALEKIEDINYLLDEFENEKRSIVLDQINLTHNLDTIINNKITALLRQPDDFSNTIRYFTLYGETINKFKSIKNHNFNIDIKSLEEMVTTKMSFILDERVINFYENNRSAARVLRDVIRKKQKFPQDEFDKLKSAFPCIISSIRDYAEYIPLKENLFDLVIIDEASQVSIAQAFPALLRAKKILVLGDQRQFSNVKANQAKSDTNQDYLNKLNQVYLEEISSNPAELIKLGKFNIKTSVLEFFEFISNFNIQLTKHFRGYKELISYSNKYFYQNNLQVMKIRAKKIDDVLKFTQLNVEKTSDIPNTNIEEIEFIVSQLENNYNEKKIQSIGIITPHTNQQKLFAEIINQLDFKDYLYEENKLKIMTFDTCQGEERDLIYYSMVATKEIDRLWGVFIKDLSKIDIEEEGKIKAQRLNVGLSRARECMHFVISKPIEEFTGSIGEALRHYSLTLKEAKSQKDISTVDKNSPMEAKVLEWFYQTSFYSQNKNNLEFIPQFKLGEYLKQLDPFYSHPNYTVDFLLVYKDSMNNERKIIIEYDGFQEHFVEVDEVNEYNYENYYSEDDIYRQKVLESYGYKFLRINRFNLTQDPVSTLNTRILELISGNYSRPKLLENISETISSLQNRDMLECPKCNEIKTLSEFKDNNLISGVGRYCSTCKKHTTKEEIIDGEKKICPTCKSNMILRSGRYGLFYGCNRYPFCYGTRKLS